MFVNRYSLPYFHESLQQLRNMVRLVLDFPRMGINFRHVLHISQKKGGLSLCTSLLQAHFKGDWAKVDRIACCEAGGFLFASALAAQVDIPLVIIREAGKLPPPTVSVIKSPSHVSSRASDGEKETRIEVHRDTTSSGGSIVVVDDVLATGRTLHAVLRLLSKAGISRGSIRVMVVGEFPIHRGRELLRQHGFGGVNIESLLIYGGH